MITNCGKQSYKRKSLLSCQPYTQSNRCDNRDWETKVMMGDITVLPAIMSKSVGLSAVSLLEIVTACSQNPYRLYYFQSHSTNHGYI